MLNKYIDEINKKTLFNKIFYVTPNLERGLGIEELLENYHIIYCNENFIEKTVESRGVNIFKAPQGISSLDLIKSIEVKDYIKTHSKDTANIMFFRNSKALQKAAESYTILNPNPDISTRIENKINQYELLSKTHIKDLLPKSIIARITDISYEEVASELGKTFVAQFDIGHAGNSTFFIKDQEEFEEFKNTYLKTNMKVKFTEQLSYNFLTINAVATKYGTYSGGLSNQITGLIELSALKGETCGTNWNQLNISPKTRTEAIEITERIGGYLYSEGFRGYFGLDLALHNDNLYLIEINSRQTASIQNFCKLQLENGEIPLAIINLMEFLNIEFDIDKVEYNKKNNQKINASTLIVRNHFDKDIEIKKTFNGVFNIEDIRYEEEGYSFSDIYSNSKVVLIEAPEGMTIKTNEEYFKILAKGNILITPQTIDKNILKIIKQVFNNLKID